MPSVKPISGSALSETQPPLIARSWSVTTGLASAHFVISRVTSFLPALLIAVRTSWNVLPLNSRPASGITLSSATSTDFQPSAGPSAVVSAPAANRQGIQPRPKQ